MKAVLNLDRYQRIAPLYNILDLPFEYRRYRRIRPLLFEGLSGRLLDAGVGTGRNISFYPKSASVTGVDFSPAMLALARRRRDKLGAQVDLQEMDVTKLNFPDRHFDAAVATFLFCVLPDEQQVAGLSELARVVKPGGAIRLLEYVMPTHPVRRAVARLWAPWVHWAYGASFERRTEEHVPAAGLHVVESRFVVGDLLKLLYLRSR